MTPKATQGRLLIVDDDADMGDMLATGLARRGFRTETVTGAEEALARVAERDFDVVVTDLKMPGLSGAELCQRLVASRPGIQVILITAFGSMDTAIAAIRAGAYDFLPKPFELEQLQLAVERALRLRAMDRELRRLRERAAEPEMPELLGDSAAMKQMMATMRQLEGSSSSVLVTGESGTGKELVARALHRLSGRRGDFVAINCAAMPATLLESELFGHARGAFTDARDAKAGLFRRADGGTLFLDEIGDMPLELQAKLLRALQERHVRPVGGDEEVEFDARIIAATNRDLESLVEEGRFREDLYFRLEVIHIPVPPLRVRGADVLLLADHFLAQAAARAGKAITGISRPAAEKLLAYHWPGNVRELENCMERAAAMARYDQVVVDDLSEKIRDYQVTHVLTDTEDPGDLVPMAEVEARYIRRVLEVVQGNKSQAAKLLGFDRKTLYRRMERYGISSN